MDGLFTFWLPRSHICVWVLAGKKGGLPGLRGLALMLLHVDMAL